MIEHDFSSNIRAICITEPCQVTVSIWKVMQHNWLFFMFDMISYLSEIYQGLAKIIPNILDSLNYQILGTIVSSDIK